MTRVRVRVYDADGKWQGGFLDDHAGYEHRWIGSPKPHLQEVMVCLRELQNGEWFLFEFVLPRKIEGTEATDSLIDHASKACRRTPVQALRWFAEQSFGPPPALVDRVRRFDAKWPSFCASSSAKTMLSTIVQRSIVNKNDVLFSGPAQQSDLALLRQLELVFESQSGGSVGYFAGSLIVEFGIEGFIAWTNSHLCHVMHLIAERPAPDSPGGTSPANASATNSHGLVPPSLGRTEHWVLEVLSQEPDRAFRVKDLLACRTWKGLVPCPVGRSALCESLARLRIASLITYARRSYLHKKP